MGHDAVKQLPPADQLQHHEDLVLGRHHLQQVHNVRVPDLCVRAGGLVGWGWGWAGSSTGLKTSIPVGSHVPHPRNKYLRHSPHASDCLCPAPRAQQAKCNSCGTHVLQDFDLLLDLVHHAAAHQLLLHQHLFSHVGGGSTGGGQAGIPSGRHSGSGGICERPDGNSKHAAVTSSWSAYGRKLQEFRPVSF